MLNIIIITIIIIIIIMNNNNKLPTQWHITNDAKILSDNQIQFYLYVSWNRKENSCKKRKIYNTRCDIRE